MSTAGTKRKHLDIKINVEPKPKKQNHSKNRKSKSETKKATQKASKCPPILHYHASTEEKFEGQYQFEVYRPKDHNKQEPMLLVTQQAGSNLIGSTAVPPQTAHKTAQYCLGVYNRAKRSLTVTRAAGSTVVKLEPQTAYATDAEFAGFNKQVGRPAEVRSQDPVQKRADAKKLVDVFGSTRRKRQMRQREEAAVIIDRNADQDRLRVIMNEVAGKAAATGDTREKVMARIGAARVIPAHNPKATKPEDAYKLNNMFPHSLMSALNVGQIMHAAEKAEDMQTLKDRKRVPEYIISRLTLVSNTPAGPERKRKARHLALLSALIQLATARPHLRTPQAKPAVADGQPARPGGLEGLARMLNMGRQDVLEPLLDKFYQKGTSEGGEVTYTRDSHHQQLLLMHVLVVALDVEKWAMPPPQFEGLREALRMTTADLVSRFRELGCSCSATRLQTEVTNVVTSYTVRLLPDGTKTLEQCFPQQKSAAKQRGW